MIAIHGLVFLFGSLLARGVVIDEAAFRPTAAEARVPEFFRLEAAKFVYEFEPVRVTDRYVVAKVRFPSPIVSDDVENNTVHCEFFRPVGAGKRPAVIVLHILGADFALSRYLAARLADRGVAALFLKLPYYGERRPLDGKKRFLSDDIGRSVLSMRQGVCDVRRAAAWLASQPDVAPEKIGVTGISLGGIVSALTVAVDPALQRGAFLLAGGDLARVLWQMPEGTKYRELWLKSGRTFADFKALTDPFDPLTYADRLKGKRLMMIAGNVDDVIPPESATALWNAAGRPPIHWYDCGHYSAVGFLLPAVRETVDFFAEDLGR